MERIMRVVPPAADVQATSLLSLVLLVCCSLGCGGVKEQFLGVRVQEQCDGQWPICNTAVGCFMGDRSYVEGRFPGEHRVAVRLFEPSKVTVSFYLFEVAGQGERTVVNFYEDRCRARVREEVSGRTFVGEATRTGFISRSADLSGIGDHLIEMESDARTKYLAKIDVVPLRLMNVESP